MQSSNIHQTSADNTAATSHAATFLARVKGILLSPAAEWPVIDREDTAPASVFSTYVLPLAALAAAVNFIRLSVIGINMPFGGTIRSPVTAGLTNAILTCVMAVVGVALIAGIINLLAPTFGGVRDTRRAVRTSAYSLTAAYVGSFLGLLPMGTLLGFLAGLYGIYTLYLGLPLMMHSKPDKAVGYTASVVICTLVAGLILGALFGALGLGRSSAFSSFNSSPEQSREESARAVGNALGGILGSDQKGKEDIGAAISNLAKTGEQMAQQEKRNAMSSSTTSASAATTAQASTAQVSSDASQAPNPTQAVAAAGGLLTALGGALGGEHRHTPVDFHQLEGLLPASLPGMTRQQARGAANKALGVQQTTASATYQGAGNGRAEVEISDATAVSGLMDMADSMNVSQSTESDSGFEKDVTLEGRKVHEKYDRNSHHGELTTLVARRFAVTVSGDGVSVEDLEGALSSVDLKSLEALKDAGATAN